MFTHDKVTTPKETTKMSATPVPQNSPKEVLEEVSKEYEGTLTIPAKKPVPQWMLMPVGLIGAGKTTVVKPLAKRLGLIRISTDDIREKLKLRGYNYEGSRDIVQGLIKKYINLGYSVALDANTGSKIGLEYNKKTAELFPNVRQIFIHINPPEEFILNKLKNYTHTWLFRDAEHAIKSFSLNQKEFTPPNIHFAHTFDPSRNDLPEQIRQGALAIERELKK